MKNKKTDELNISINQDFPVEIIKLADKISKFSVIPFIGAGCSKAILDGNDWEGITNATAAELGLTDWSGLEPTDLAERFANKFGKAALYNLLEKKLTLRVFDDVRGCTHLAIMSLHFTTIYTTNIDNVLELACSKYNRPLQIVSRLEDLHKIMPGITTLYKYHGCLSQPSTIVWTSTDYRQRQNEYNYFLNVRLRSDLLTKTFLFIGYSLSDPHIISILKQMQNLYTNGIRKSIVIAVGDYKKFREKLTIDGLDIEVIAPAEIFPNLDPNSAWSYFLSLLAKKVYLNFNETQLINMFDTSRYQPQRLICDYELKLLEQCYSELPLANAIALFRSKLDACFIHSDLNSRVAELVVNIIKRAHEEPFDYLQLAGLIGNLCLTKESMLYIYSHACTLLATEIDQSFSIFIKLPDDTNLKFTIVCRAAQILIDSKKVLNANFINWVAHQYDLDKTTFEKLPIDLQGQVRFIYNQIFSQSPLTNPITMVKSRLPGYRTRSELLDSMIKSLPHQISKPNDQL